MMSEEKFKNLTAKEYEILLVFQSEMQKPLENHSDLNNKWTLLRFLRARRFDLKKTKEMFLNFLEFREKKDYLKIMNRPYSDFQQFWDGYKSGYCHHSFEGNLVVIDQPYKSKLAEIASVAKDSDAVDYLIQRSERTLHIVFPVLSEMHKKRCDKVILIYDFKGFSLTSLTNGKLRDFVSLMIDVSQNYYPELLEVSYMINSPSLFFGIWMVIKSMMDKKTADKFIIVTGDGLNSLSKIMDVNLLPISMGGQGSEELSFFNGPWDQQMKDSWENKSFYLKDRSIEYKYFGDSNNPITTQKEQKKSRAKKE